MANGKYSLKTGAAKAGTEGGFAGAFVAVVLAAIHFIEARFPDLALDGESEGAVIVIVTGIATALSKWARNWLKNR